MGISEEVYHQQELTSNPDEGELEHLRSFFQYCHKREKWSWGQADPVFAAEQNSKWQLLWNGNQSSFSVRTRSIQPFNTQLWNNARLHRGTPYIYKVSRRGLQLTQWRQALPGPVSAGWEDFCVELLKNHFGPFFTRPWNNVYEFFIVVVLTRVSFPAPCVQLISNKTGYPGKGRHERNLTTQPGWACTPAISWEPSSSQLTPSSSFWDTHSDTWN